MATGAAAVIIGNEVLTAKVEEQNGAFLIQRLRQAGVPLRLLTIVPDEVDAIVEAVSRARAVAQYVFTSGGIGPTHDDVTVRAVALALGRAVVRHPELEQEVRAYFGERLTPQGLRLAEVPEGAELLRREGVWYPVLSCAGVFMLPGVPQLFRIQLETVLARLPCSPVFLKTVHVAASEPEIAGVVDQVALAFPEVGIGSYPQFERGLDHKVRITIEAARAELVEAATADLLARLPADRVVRVLA
jgi:molybdenum cofactor synthesis domain-containing protein